MSNEIKVDIETVEIEPETSTESQELEKVVQLRKTYKYTYKGTDYSVSEIRLTEPDAKTLRDASKMLKFTPDPDTGKPRVELDSSYAYSIKLVSGNTDIPVEVVERFKVSVIEEATDFLTSFSFSAQSTSKPTKKK
jgi:hypothetical protein